MYCTKCGAKIEEKNKFCPQCGSEISSKMNPAAENLNTGSAAPAEDEEKSAPDRLAAKLKDIFFSGIDLPADKEYLYFPGLKHRNSVYGVSLVIEKILMALTSIAGVIYIIQQIHLAEGYKLMIYIIGFIVATLPFVMIGEVFGLIKSILKYEKKDMKGNYDPKLFLGLTIFSYVIAFVAMFPFLNPSETESAKWMLVIGFGSFYDLLKYFSFTIILLIISGIVSITIQNVMLVKKEEEQK